MESEEYYVTSANRVMIFMCNLDDIEKRQRRAEEVQKEEEIGERGMSGYFCK